MLPRYSRRATTKGDWSDELFILARSTAASTLLRHHLLGDSHDIRYTHVFNRGAAGVRSPADRMFGARPGSLCLISLRARPMLSVGQTAGT